MVVKYYLINDLDDMSLNCQPEINDLMSSYSFKQYLISKNVILLFFLEK